MKTTLQLFSFYGFMMERYKFKVKGPKEKCIKIFLTAEEVKMLESESVMAHILTQFPSLHGK